MNSFGSQSRARLALAGLLLAFVATLLAFGRPASAAPAPVQGGSLDWGVKQSFRAYITGPVASGDIVLNGATQNADGSFRFGGGTGTVDSATGAMDLSFAGSVQFTGHDMGEGPLLDLTISDIRIEVSGANATLIADVASKGLDSEEVANYPDITFATLDFAGIAPQVGASSITFANVPATLTAEGAPAMAGFYEAGEALDPVTITLALGAASTPTSTATATTTATATATATTTATVTTTATTTTTATATASPTTTPPAAQPKVTLSKSVLSPDGDTITVTGTGFLPSLATASRPPLAGRPAGVYVAFGAFADAWKPSAGAPSSARPTADGAVKWAVPADSRAIVGEDASVTLNPDGTFTATLAVKRGYAGALPDGNYGIYTYTGGGAVQPLYETFTAVSFSASTQTPAPQPPKTGTGLAGTEGGEGQLVAAGLLGAVLVLGGGGSLLAIRRRGVGR